MTHYQNTSTASNRVSGRVQRRHRRQRTGKLAWSEGRSQRESHGGWGYVKRRVVVE